MQSLIRLFKGAKIYTYTYYHDYTCFFDSFRERKKKRKKERKRKKRYVYLIANLKSEFSHKVAHMKKNAEPQHFHLHTAKPLHPRSLLF